MMGVMGAILYSDGSGMRCRCDHSCYGILASQKRLAERRIVAKFWKPNFTIADCKEALTWLPW